MGIKHGLTDVLEAEIQILKAALERFDFAKLRAHHRQLAGGADPCVFLRMGRDGMPDIELPPLTRPPVESS